MLIDTLHFTHCVRPGVVRWSDVESFDRQLAALGCKLLFLLATPATLWERGIVPRVGAQFIEEYARKFGRTHEEIHQHFVREQEILGELFSHSVMPKLPLQNNIAQNDADCTSDVVEAAFRFWTDDVDMEKAA